MANNSNSSNNNNNNNNNTNTNNTSTNASIVLKKRSLDILTCNRIQQFIRSHYCCCAINNADCSKDLTDMVFSVIDQYTAFTTRQLCNYKQIHRLCPQPADCEVCTQNRKHSQLYYMEKRKKKSDKESSNISLSESSTSSSSSSSSTPPSPSVFWSDENGAVSVLSCKSAPMITDWLVPTGCDKPTRAINN